ncbi:putative uncharacterized transposon-derived protein F52C9.6, partial [Varanus komodoensis]
KGVVDGSAKAERKRSSPQKSPGTPRITLDQGALPDYAPCPLGGVQPHPEQGKDHLPGELTTHQQDLHLVWIKPQFIGPHPAHHSSQTPVKDSHCLTWIRCKREVELGVISTLMTPQPKPLDDLSQWFHADDFIYRVKNFETSDKEQQNNKVLYSTMENNNLEHIMRKMGLDESPVGIKIAGRNINNLRYADDSTLMAESKGELKSLLMRVKEESAKVGLKLNIKKTKIMASGPLTFWQTDGEEMEVVTDFIFLGSKITADRDCSQEIKRGLFLGRKAMANLDSILKSRNITLPTKLVQLKDVDTVLGTGEAGDVLNQCLTTIMNWMRANKLKLNPDKTEMLLVDDSFDRIMRATCLGQATLLSPGVAARWQWRLVQRRKTEGKEGKLATAFSGQAATTVKQLPQAQQGGHGLPREGHGRGAGAALPSLVAAVRQWQLAQRRPRQRHGFANPRFAFLPQ